MEHLEKSSPLIVEEMARWQDLLWDDYIYITNRVNLGLRMWWSLTVIAIIETGS